MRQRKPKFVNEYVDSHGKPRVYLRRPGQGANRLASAFVHAGILDGLSCGNERYERMPEVRRVKVGSIAAVVRPYYGSTEFKALAVSTRDTYSGVLDRFVDKHGEGPIAGLQPKHINKLIDEMADTPSAASNFRKRLKGLMDYAVSAGLRSDNPVVVASLKSATPSARKLACSAHRA
ncbi:hypothetical protein GGD66_002528 [Bradyrhizobium sp. CIR48]|uniref:hypothetical protein n=1 Tax=Bradyrhizobium sp. CIR48 TaxID=2663840 RepID=UPI001605DA28|nr:hypothetical protein [Bradyrhizobium sp. CIR48]MBB4423984.1 hypothetical protein [Bradyrhizobium sp. CIR48]